MKIQYKNPKQEEWILYSLNDFISIYSYYCIGLFYKAFNYTLSMAITPYMYLRKVARYEHWDMKIL